jgi:GntR family transcriptional regulator, sialic acid-inducible nan operon repressor
MSSLAKPIARRRLYEGVVEHLETQIHDGVYAPGDELPSERKLMQDLGVGRPAIREALFALQKMGLVALSSGERPRVIEPSQEAVMEAMRGPIQRMINKPGGLKDFQRARIFFEVGIAREAAAHATPEDMEALQRALKDNLEAVGRTSLFERTDAEFHLALARISRNPIFLAIHDAVFGWLHDQRRVTLAVANQIDNVCREHEEIFAAIRDCNPDRAERAMRGHLMRGHKLYWSLMEGGRTEPPDL